MKNLWKKVVLAAAVTAGAAVWLSTCDVGLGASVDTQAPSLEIKYPESGAVYSGDIPVNGTWSDDKGVSKIEITIKNTSKSSSGEEETVYLAEILEEKAWTFGMTSGRSAESTETGTTGAGEGAESGETGTGTGNSGDAGTVNKKLYLPDGKYEINVTAYDASGHSSGARSRSFIVDSTPPVFILTKPNSINIEDPAVYGRTVQITGKISEDNVVESMKVKVFKINEDGTETEVALKKDEFTNFDPLDTAVTVAKYYDSEDTAREAGKLDEYLNYAAMYGDKDSANFDKTQKYHAEITLKDNAGNESEKTYIGTYLDDVLSASEAAGGIGTKLESSEIKNLLNGSYTGSLSESQKARAMKIFDGTAEGLANTKYLADAEKKLSFTVDSRANPTYAMSSEFLKSKLGEVMASGSLNITINSGLDNDMIDPSTLKITIYETDVITGEPKEGRYLKFGPKYIYQGQGDRSLEGITTPVSSASYKIIISKFKNITQEDVDSGIVSGIEGGTVEDYQNFLKQAKSYCLKLEGKDKSENRFMPQDGDNEESVVYGFTIQASQMPPVVEFEGYEDGEETKVPENGEYIKATEFSEEKGRKLKFAVSVEDGAALTVTSVVRIYKDRIVTGKNLSFTENAVTGEKNLPAQTGADIGKEQIIEVPVSLELTGDNYTVAVRVTVEKEGAVPVTETVYFYADNKAPVVSADNSELTGSKTVTEENTSALSESGGKKYYTIKGKWSDKDGSGTDSLMYRYRKTGETEWSEWRTLSEADAPKAAGTTSWNIKTEVNEERDFAVQYKAKDQSGNESETVTHEGITIDLGVPAVTLKQGTAALSSTYKKSTEPVLLRLTAKDTNALKAVNVKVYKDEALLEGTAAETAAGVTVSNPPLEDGDKNSEVTVEFTADGNHDGVFKVEVQAEDISGRTSEIYTAVTTIDGNAPAAKDGTFKVNGEAYSASAYQHETRVPVSGEYEDVSLDTVYVYLKKPGDTTEAGTELSGLTGVKTIRSFDANKFEETSLVFGETSGSSTNTVYIQAKDKAGNLSSVSAYTVNVDLSSPTVTLKQGTAALSSTYKKNTNPVLELTAKDTNALEEVSVKVYKDNTLLEGTAAETAAGVTVTNAPAEAGEKSHEVSVAFTADGEHDGVFKVEVQAKDIAGGESAVYTAETTVDGTPPAAEGAVKISGADYSSTAWYSEKKPVISGGYTESYLDTVYIYLKKSGDGEIVSPLSSLTGVKSIRSFEGTNFEETSLTLSENANTLYVQAKDKAGNLSSVSEYTINVDTSDPVVSVTEGEAALSSIYKKDAAAVLKVTASDTNALGAVNVKVYKKSLLGVVYTELTDPESEGITVENAALTSGAKTHDVTVSFTTDGTKDGDYRIEVTASDVSGRTSETYEVLTTIDGTAPVINGDIKLDGSAYSASSFNGTTKITVSGEYTERTLETVYLYVKKPGDTGSAPADLTVQSVGAKQVKGFESSNEFESSLDFENNAGGNANTLYIQSKDKAGNLSEVTSYTVNVDTADPTLSVTDVLSAYYKKGTSPLLKLTAEDTNALKKVEVKLYKKSGGNYAEAADSECGATVTGRGDSAAGTRSQEVTVAFTADGTKDGEYRVEVTAEDVGGRKSSVYTGTTVVDGTAPVIISGNTKIEGEAYDAQKFSDTNKLSVTGEYTEANIAAVYYIAKTAGASIDTSAVTDLSTVSGTKTFASFEDGAKYSLPAVTFGETNGASTNTLYVQAKDKAGNLSAITAYTINVDTKNPVVSVKQGTQALSGYYKKAAVSSLELTAKDENPLSSVEVKVYKDGTLLEGTEAETAAGVTVENAALTSGANSHNVTVSFTTNGTKDGEYRVEVTAEDAAGHTSAVYTATTVVDGTAPQGVDGTMEVEGKPYAENGFSSQAKLSVTGKYADANLEAVYGYVRKAGSSDDMSAVTDLSALSGVKTVTTFTQGADGLKFELPSLEFANNTSSQANTLYVQAKDKAGNLSVIKPFTINIDTTPAKPTFEAYRTEGGTVTQVQGQAFVNGTKSITIYGQYYDEVSGVESLTLLKDGEAYTGAAEIKYSSSEVTDTASAGAVTNWKDYSADDSKTIRSFKVTFTPTEGGSITLSGRNGAGVSGTSDGSLTLVVDGESPSVTAGLYYADAESGAKGAALFSKDDTYYTNPDGKWFTVSGNLTDNYSLDRAEFVIKEGGTVKVSKSASFDKASGSLLIEKFQFTGITKVDSAELTVYDKAGNSKKEEFTVVFDRQGPSGYHEVDSADKDLYFRIGGADNDDIAEGSILWDNDLDKDAGKKYSEGTYGKDSQIRVRGNITDAGSGVATIYYHVFDKEIKTEGNSTTPVLSGNYYAIKDEASLTKWIAENPTGSFAPLVTADTRRVFYNIKEENVRSEDDFDDPTNPSGAADKKGTRLGNSPADGYWKFYKNVENTYDYKISGFDNPKNYLVIVAEDNIGNRNLDYVDVYDEDKGEILRKIFATINYDNVQPSVTSSAESRKIKFVNTEEKNGSVVFKNGTDITLTGTASDEGAGLKSVVIEVNGHEVTETENDYGVITKTVSGDTWNWSATLKALAFHGASGTVIVNAKATDDAGDDGNTFSNTVATVIIDTESPTLTLVAPTDADANEGGTQVNKKILFNGTADDDNSLPSDCVTGLEYSKKTDGWTEQNAVWTDYTGSGMYGLSGSYSFKVTDFDTEDLDDGASYKIRAVAVDMAGNKGYSDPVEVIVSQDSDRPVINLTNLTLKKNSTTYLKSTTRLEGTVSDDDGAVTAGNLKYSKDGTTWNDVTLTGSAWNIPGLEEGDNTLYFKVTDSKGTTFTTALAGSGATDATQPKVKDEAGTYVTVNNGSLALKFKVATKKPDFKSPTYSVHDSSKNEWEDRGTSLGTLGGKYDKFKISVEAKSASEISGVKAVYDGTDYNFTCGVAHADGEYHTWTSPEIPLSDKTSVALTISDNSDPEDPMTAETTVDVAIDNTEPAVTIKDPPSQAGVKETMTVEVSEIATVYYGVTKAYANGTTGAEVTAEPSSWTQITDETNGLTRYVYFDDVLDKDDHTDRFAIYLTEKHLSITTKADIEKITNPYETITPVKFWAKAVDRCGNETVVSKTVNVDPQGNRPTVTLGYPVNVLKDGVSQTPKLGGTIRIDGNATDDVSVKYVWLQIERDGNAFSGADVKWLKSKGYAIGNMTTNELLADGTINALSNNASVSDYAIRITPTGNSWNCSINGNQEFNKAGGEANLKLRLYATDADPNHDVVHRSAAVEQLVTIDSRTPYINESELVLVKYDGNVEVARQQYKSGASVHGIWYLQGTIRDDDSGLKTVEYKRTGDTDVTAAITAAGQEKTNIGNDIHFYFTKTAHGDDAAKFDYKFSIPLGKTASGTVGEDSVYIYAAENTDQNYHVEQTYKVVYDNKAPVFNTDTGNPFVKLSSDVRNTNGFYTFGAIASEDKVNDVAQSGVERIAFYFTRDLNYSLSELNSTLYNKHTGEKDSKTNDLFDIMLYHSNVDDDDVSSGNMIVNYQGKASGENPTLKHADGLYWRSYSGSSSGKTFTYTNANVDANIHAGGLVKIGGVIYKIESVSGKTVSVSSTISGTTADFALCNVIDASGEKNGTSVSSVHGYGYGYYGTRGTDDGDLITETFNNQGTDWIFDASINSKNLPDGPVTLHMVAFDKAGNCSETPYTMTGTVKNNAPRIAGVVAGTDENGNGAVDDAEFITSFSNKYDKGYDASGNEINDATFPVKTGDEQKSLLTVKGLTVVKPEIIGGNGALSYSYKVYPYDSGTGTWPDTTTIVNAGGDLKNASGTVLSGTTDTVVTAQITLPVSDFIGKTTGEDSNYIPDGTKTKFTFTFGDSTPGTSATDNTGKNSASVSVIMDVALRETNAANNWILPFYWKSKDDNSLFKQSKDYGHIELSKDWVTAPGYNAGNAEFDADPKVSGMIKIEGIAQDDTLLDAINVQFGKSMGGLGTIDTAIATYNAAGASWTVTALQNDGSISTSTGWASAVQQATYQDLLDVGIIDALPENTEASAKVPYTSQEYGHVVHWILYVNTAKVTDVAATNVTVTATALDRGKPKWNGTAAAYTSNDVVITGTPDEENAVAPFSGAVTKNGNTVTAGDLTGSYRMDVVPYITGIKTPDRKNSGLKDNNIRSASGKYSIMRYNSSGSSVANFIEIYGFNLNPDVDKQDVRYVNESQALGRKDNDDRLGHHFTWSSTASDYKLTKVKNGITYSGYVELFTNDVVTLNNVNSNDAYGTAKNANGVQLTKNNAVNDSNNSDYLQAYNREPDYYTTKNIQLTDDRYVRVFDMKDTKLKNGYYPNMIVNKTNSATGINNVVFGIVNPSGAKAIYGNVDHVADFKPQRYVFKPDGTKNGTPEVLIGGSAWDQMAMAQDDSGRYHHLTVFNRATCSMSYIYDRFSDLSMTSWYTKDNQKKDVDVRTGRGWGAGVGYSSYAVNASDEGKNNALTLEDIDYKASLVDRYQNLKVIAKGNSTNTTGSSVFLAYYDDGITDNSGNVVPTLCFRNFKIGTSALGKQLYRESDHTGATVYTASDGGTYSQNTNMTESTGDASYNKGRNEIASDASQYFDMVAIPEGTNKYRVVVVYYDGEKLHLKYSTNTLDGSNPDSTTIGFTENTSISMPNSVGQYVSMTADVSGGIHIAAFDAGDSDLVYIYVSKYNATSCSSMTVDQYGSAGNWTNIKIDTTSGHTYYNKPIIAYTNSTENGGRDAIKVAVAKDVVGSVSAGVDENNYTTGNWEYMTVPAITPPQCITAKFRQVGLDFNTAGKPVVGYLGTNLEFGNWLDEAQ